MLMILASLTWLETLRLTLQRFWQKEKPTVRTCVLQPTVTYFPLEWFTLSNKDKFAGKVYLELTFWSNVRRSDLSELSYYITCYWCRNLHLKRKWPPNHSRTTSNMVVQDHSCPLESSLLETRLPGWRLQVSFTVTHGKILISYRHQSERRVLQPIWISMFHRTREIGILKWIT